MTDGWHDLTTTFVLKDARIVATLGYDGGAIVERISRLHCSEGRRPEWHGMGDDKDMIATLGYIFDFFIKDAPAPDQAEGAAGRIVVTGFHEGNGRWMEIRGDGHVGYDDNGNVEGSFTVPPMILCESHGEEDSTGSEEPAEADMEPSWRLPRAKLPPQYKAATTRMPPQDEDF